MAARACANFGVSDFVVVHAEKFNAAMGRAGRSPEKARQLGVSGGDVSACSQCTLDVSAWKGCERLATTEGAEVLRTARLCSGLQTALAGVGRSVAFSGRDGENFRRSTVQLRSLARDVVDIAPKQAVAAGALEGSCQSSVALVFGSEDFGLSTESVLMCDDVCKLRTSTCPSLNLSHAVAVVLARLFEETEFGTERSNTGASAGSKDLESSAPCILGQHSTNASKDPVRVEQAGSETTRAPEHIIDVADSDGDGMPEACTGLVAGKQAADGMQALAGWTASWSELCRQRFVALGYPAQLELWHGRGRRRCKFAYRLFRLVAQCSRTLQRASATAEEAAAWQRLVEVLVPVDDAGICKSGPDLQAAATSEPKVDLPADGSSQP